MNFYKAIQLSKLTEAQEYNKCFDLINDYYKPNNIIDLLNQIKKSLFHYNKTMPLKRNIDGQDFNLNINKDNFLLAEEIEDEVINGSLVYKVNFPNLLSISNRNINIISIIKNVKVKDKWIDINSYNSNEVSLLLDNLEIKDFKKIQSKYNDIIKTIENYYFIKLYNVEEYFDIQKIIAFILNTYYFEVEELYRLMMLGMRHFNMSYNEFKSINIFEFLYMSKIGKKIIKEENELNIHKGMLNKLK